VPVTVTALHWVGIVVVAAMQLLLLAAVQNGKTVASDTLCKDVPDQAIETLLILLMKQRQCANPLSDKTGRCHICPATLGIVVFNCALQPCMRCTA
jgi:hypothetical protein